MADGKPSAPKALSEAYGWYVLAVIFIAAVFSYLDRQILSLLIIPIKNDLHLSDTQVSLLMGLAFALVYSLIGLPFGWLVDRAKRINVIAGGVFFWSLMTTLSGTAHSFTLLFLCRMGVGTGEAALAPAAYSMLPDYFQPSRLGMVMGIYGAAMGVGGGIAYIFGAQVIDWLSHVPHVTLPIVGTLYSWQLVFVAVGLPGVLVALWVLTLKEAPRRGKLRLQTSESGETKLGTVAIGEVLAYTKKNARTYYGLCFGFALIAITGYSGQWIPTFMARTHGFSLVEAGQWLGIVIIPSGLLGILLGGLFGDWVVRRGYENGRVMVMAGASLVTAPFAILYPVVNDPNLMLTLLFFFFFFTSFVSAAWMASMPQIVPNQMRGLSIAIAVVINNLLGMGIGPTLIAVITDYVFKDEMALRYSLSIACGGSLLLASLIFFMAIGSYSRSLRYRETWQDNDQKSA